MEPGGWTRLAAVKSEPCPPELGSPSAPHPSGSGCLEPYGTYRSFSIENTKNDNYSKSVIFKIIFFSFFVP